MEQIITISVKPSFSVSIFPAYLLPLILLAAFSSGCYNDQSESIQSVVSREHMPLVAPMTHNQLKKENHHQTKPSNNIYQNPVLIKANKSQLNIQPSLTDNTLHLGNSRIEHWPFGLPACKSCNLKIERKFHPDGPDTRLVLSHADTLYQWGIFQSGQKQSYLLDKKLYFDEQDKLNMVHKNKQTILQTGQTYHVNNCAISPLWIETIPALSPAYSDDQAKHKIQILFECR